MRSILFNSKYNNLFYIQQKLTFYLLIQINNLTANSSIKSASMMILAFSHIVEGGI